MLGEVLENRTDLLDPAMAMRALNDEREVLDGTNWAKWQPSSHKT
jgi:hypothetical protein